MKKQRNEFEVTLDRWLVLSALAACKKPPGNFNIQKVFFISEDQCVRKGWATPSFKYFRWTYGPYSRDLAEDVQALRSAGLVTGSHQLSERGQRVVDRWGPILKQRAPQLAQIEGWVRGVAAEHGHRTTKALKAIVYAMEVEPFDMPGKKLPVGDIHPPCDLLVPYWTDGLKVPAVDPDLAADLFADLALTTQALVDRDVVTNATSRKAAAILGL